MTFRSVAIVAALAAVCAFGAVGVALAIDGSDRSTLFAALNGTNELDPANKKGAGDLDGAGGFNLTFDAGLLCFGLTVANISTPVAAHIHLGKSSENGPVVVPLTPLPANGDPGSSSGCVTVTSPMEQAITANPGAYYVNVHTGDFPGGAVRGQLSK